MNMTIKEALSWASSLLKQNNTENADMEAEFLLRHISGLDRAWLLSRFSEELSEEQMEAFKIATYRRIKHEPLQHIIGYQEFYGRKFFVNKDVLIPRPETEILVEELLKEINLLWEDKKVCIADIGTGSGAIAVTLALEMENIPQLHTIDISSSAIAVAKKNAAFHQANVKFHEGNLLEPLIEAAMKVDIIVSNPPYIPQRDIEELMKEVKDFEPRQALDGGIDGLDFYREIILQSKNVLKENGVIAFELGIHQSKEVSDLLKNNGFTKIQVIPDLQLIPRVIIAKK